jgi:hypothetical protein
VSPGLFDVSVLYKNRNISEMKLQLDDLLERQHNNNLELETDFLKLNVNMVILFEVNITILVDLSVEQVLHELKE